MTTIKEVCDWLEELAPLALSESWDNTGLLLGDAATSVQCIQTCLTVTEETVEEAIQRKSQLVVAHHPLPFKPVGRITCDSHVGRLLWRLASHGIALYSPHTAWDSAPLGINGALAELLALTDVGPILPPNPDTVIATSQAGDGTRIQGTGRWGRLPKPSSAREIADALQSSIVGCRPRAVYPDKKIETVAIVCGSGASLLESAIALGAELFLTGEATYHNCLLSQAAKVPLLMIGHYASERFAMERMASLMLEHFPRLEIWASEVESDPVAALDV